MRIFGTYIKERLKVVCCLLCMEGIAFFTLWLQGTELHRVSYALFLSLFILALVGAMDFPQYLRRRRELEQVQKSIVYNLDVLPEPQSADAEMYQNLIRALFRAKSEEVSTGIIARQELLDYYGLWAHQIKTPISGLHLLLQSQREDFTEETLDVERLVEGNRRMGMELFRIERYVEMVLSYLRMEDMGKDLLLKKYRVAPIVNQAVRKFSKEFIYRKIKLVKDEIDVTALTDEKWLLLVLEQVLSNSLKYTREGGTVHMYGIKGRKILVIKDTGIGIRKEDLPRVCEKGFTGYNGREDKKSTGIGLYLCKNIMDKLNHGFQITSEPGEGTTVYLNFEREEMGIE